MVSQFPHYLTTIYLHLIFNYFKHLLSFNIDLCIYKSYIL
ncbi:hypothetical protein rpr22_0816 [Rickettsia prowazekii str. Rp22]|uniref:Uncharacterized protein n=1 Tax=Rickettsia prowazekii (strain Rp22) TaxID=449216 RepID=D5AY34_RICPP|nr:hypothetical protein rpr22_0816 [Rickettsia prowazekii str. Rp22]